MKKFPLVSFAFCLSLAAILSALLSGPGSQWGWWHFRTGFMILKISAYCGLAVVILASIGLMIDHQILKPQGLMAILIGLSVAGVPWGWMRVAKKVPMIHDITTDTDHPPAFVSVLPLRKDAVNPSEYGGPEIAEKQKTAYPDIVTLKMEIPADRAFLKALQAAQNMKWAIVDSNPKEGRIEATATTFWFRFKDDIVVRILPDKGGSKIDARSVSRVGKSDVGTNARRIRQYIKLLEKI